MILNKWEKFFKMHLPFVNATNTAAPTRYKTEQADARLPYKILVLCHTDDAAHVEQLMTQELLNAYVVQYQHSKLVGKGNLTNIAVEILCTISERAKVVQLVARLGLEKSVRSVRWESIPAKATA